MEYFSPQELSESVAGVRMPEVEIVTRQEAKAVDQKEKMETYMELEKQINDAKKFLAEWEDTIELFCQDEAAITNTVSS